MSRHALLLLAALSVASCKQASPEVLPIATTTSVEASGLLDRLMPAFETSSGLKTRVVVSGSGQALKLLERGDVDAVLTHDRIGEMLLVDRGVAERHEVMSNWFLLVGPAADPAGAKGKPIVEAFASIKSGGHPFVSRGDDSGTHRAELRLWKDAGGRPSPPAYREAGQGMGETLMMADELHAYALVDSATLTTFSSRVALVPLVTGDERLRNPYSVLWRTPSGKKFADWLRSDEARAMMPPLFEPAP